MRLRRMALGGDVAVGPHEAGKVLVTETLSGQCDRFAGSNCC